MWENKFERAKIFSRKKLRKFFFKFTRFSTFSVSFSLILWFCFSCHLELTTTLPISARMNFFQHRGAKEIHIFTRRASRNEWFNLMNFLSWKLTLPQHDFPSPSGPRLLLKFSSQFFINTCFHRDMRSRFLSLSLSWCILVIILKCPWEIIAVWKCFFFSCPWMHLWGGKSIQNLFFPQRRAWMML